MKYFLSLFTLIVLLSACSTKEVPTDNLKYKLSLEKYPYEWAPEWVYTYGHSEKLGDLKVDKQCTFSRYYIVIGKTPYEGSWTNTHTFTTKDSIVVFVSPKLLRITYSDPAILQSVYWNK